MIPWLRAQLPAGSVVEAEPVGFRTDGLPPEEASLIAAARPVRRAAFVAGRLAARRALSLLAPDAGPLLAHRDGDPVWPDHVVGSITHAEGWAIAALSPKTALSGLGVDLESDSPINADLADLICRPEESAAEPHLRRLGIDGVKLRFVAKEAWYKAIFPATRRFIGFDEVSVEIDAAAGRFRARFAGDATAGGIPVPPDGDGAFLRADGMLCAVCALPPCRQTAPAVSGNVG